MSRKENEYAALLDKLGTATTDDSDKHIMGEMILNLFARTNNTRKGFAEIGEIAFDCYDRAMGSDKFTKSIRAQTVERILEDPRIKALVARFPKKRRRRIVSALLSASGINIQKSSEALWKLIRGRLHVEDMSKTAQLKFLAAGKPSDDKRKLFDRRWHIESREPGVFVLGDVGPIARFSDTPILVPLFHFGTASTIVLPISNCKLLVGTLDDSKPIFEAEEVNLASVECSRDFFIASVCTDRETGYQPRIGLRALFITGEKAKQALDEVMEDEPGNKL